MRSLGILIVAVLGLGLVACNSDDDANDPVCGDGMCTTNAEDCATCAADCGQCPPGCGNGTCDTNETCTSCSADCGQCPPGCGDGTCDANETCASCSADCGSCSCGADPFACTGETICIEPDCQNAFGRTYTVSVFSLVVKTTDPNGETWDAVGGAPDPYVTIELNDVPILTTTENQNTFEPTFSESASVVIPAGAKFRFDAWDADVADDDWIIGCEINPLTADYLRAYGPVCNGTVQTGTDGTVLDILIAPN